MSLANNTNSLNLSESFQENFTEVIQQTIKLGYPQEMLVNSNACSFSCLNFQNEFLKGQVNELQKLVLQYEFTNKKALETLRDNIMLRDKVMTLELKVGILSETADLQTLEIKKRDHSISSLRKDVAEHNKRIELLSDKFEENGYPACDICCRNPPVVTICKNHPEGEQIVGCVFCALRKCPLCRSKNLERSFVLNENSKKIKKIPKCKATIRKKLAYESTDDSDGIKEKRCLRNKKK